MAMIEMQGFPPYDYRTPHADVVRQWCAQIAPYMHGEFEPLAGVHQQDCLINLQHYYGAQWKPAYQGEMGPRAKFVCKMIVATHRYMQRAKRLDAGEQGQESREALIERMRRHLS